MTITVQEKNKRIKELINGMYEAVKAIINVETTISKPNLLQEPVDLKFGVLIGITGDIKGQLILEGESSLFADLGNLMFGMPLEGEMLNSFSGELGNMVAGQLCTIVSSKEVNIDITSPTVAYGDVSFAGYKHIICINVMFSDLGKMDIYMMLQ